MNTTFVKWGAVTAAATLAFLPTAANAADKVVARAAANGITVALAGNGFDSGVTVEERTGDKVTKTGEPNPPIAVLGNQNLINAGVLAQDTDTSIVQRDGESAACAGTAGNGASIADVGDSNCITPGDPLGLSIANLDLTGAILIDPESALGGLSPLNAIIPQLVGPLTAAISDGLEPLGATGLAGTLGAVEARCNARPGVAEGTANIVDTKLTLSLGGTDIDLVELPASPPPNTHVLTNLDVVLNVVLDALRVDINNTLDGALAPLSAIIDPIQDQIVNNLIAQIAPQLAPLEDNILDITLNEQSTPEKGSITVTALHLELLPAAAQFADGALLDIKIGNVGCGPNARVDTPDEPDNPDNPDNPDLPDGPNNPDLPEVPTIVDSGLAGTSTDGGPGSPLLWGILGATVVATAGAGSVTGRRLVRR